MITGDFETRSIVDLPRVGMMRYATDPSTQVLCFCWSFDEDPEVHLWHRDHPWIEKSERPDELLSRIKDGELFEAHNAKFEYGIWNLVLRREFPEFDVPLKMEQVRCSAAKASCLSIRRGLGDAVSDLELDERKDPDGERLINKLSKPMAKRRIGKSTYSLALQDILFDDLCEFFEPGRIFTMDTVLALANDISGELLDSQSIGRVMRKTLTVMREQDLIQFYPNGVQGEYRWLDKSPPDRESQRTIEEHINELRKTVVWCEEEIEHRRNWAYCQQDVRAERGLSNFCPEMTERELAYWQMDFRMNMRGIKLDRQAANEAVKLCAAEVLRLDKEMQDITGGRVPGGSKRKAFRAWVNEQIRDLQDLGGADIEEIPDTKADTLSFRLYGVPTKASEEAKKNLKPIMDAKWAGFGDAGAAVRRAMEISLEVNKSSVSKFKTMCESVCPDGRLHDIMLYNGADRTGRWSGQGVQPHNFVRGYSKEMPVVWEALLTQDPDIVTLVTGDLMLPALAKACRGALIASPGNELYAADFSAIEARKLAWLSNCSSQLKLFQTKGDPYIDMAAGIYKMDVDATDPEIISWFKKEHGDKRQMGKKAVLGLGYAMGWEKFQTTVYNEEGVWLDDEFCKMVVNVYRKLKCPEVPKLWKAANDAAIAAVQDGDTHWFGGDPETGNGMLAYFVSGRFLHCQLPSGRLLAYLDPEVHTKVNYRYPAKNARGSDTVVTFPARPGVPMNRVKRHAERLAEKQNKILTGDPPDSYTTPHLSFMGRHIISKQWQRLGTHGGTLVENADQASSRDLLAEAMYRIDQGGQFDLLLSIHDEVIAEAPVGTAKVKEFEAIMSEVPDWAPGMPIEAEGWIGPRLRK